MDIVLQHVNQVNENSMCLLIHCIQTETAPNGKNYARLHKRHGHIYEVVKSPVKKMSTWFNSFFFCDSEFNSHSLKSRHNCLQLLPSLVPFYERLSHFLFLMLWHIQKISKINILLFESPEIMSLINNHKTYQNLDVLL